MADAQPTTEAPSQPAQTNQQQIQVNIDYLKTTKVHICMPCYGGMLTEQTFMSYVKWGNTCRQLGLDWTVETMTNESLISRARNTLTAKFLNTPESTHLMFIDADIGWEPWHLLVLLDRDVDVIGGLYPMKSIPIKWCVNGIPGQEEGVNGLVEVTKTGTGFLLIKREVFEKLKDLDFKEKLRKTHSESNKSKPRGWSKDRSKSGNWLGKKHKPESIEKIKMSKNKINKLLLAYEVLISVLMIVWVLWVILYILGQI